MIVDEQPTSWGAFHLVGGGLFDAEKIRLGFASCV
jgi:hypothetical protein